MPLKAVISAITSTYPRTREPEDPFSIFLRFDAYVMRQLRPTNHNASRETMSRHEFPKKDYHKGQDS